MKFDTRDKMLPPQIERDLFNKYIEVIGKDRIMHDLDKWVVLCLLGMLCWSYKGNAQQIRATQDFCTWAGLLVKFHSV